MATINWDSIRIEGQAPPTERSAEWVALDTWIREHGTESQRARWAEHLLPEEEIRDVVRAWAFAPIDRPRWRNSNLERGALRHYEDCARECFACRVSPAGALSEVEYAALRALREQAAIMPTPHRIDVRAHRCACKTCGASVVRNSALLIATYAGFEFSREYAL